MRGIPEKFPKLRIAFLECGAGWVPYWMERMDEEWEKRGDVEAPLCKHKPSEYIAHGNWFFATEPEEGMLALRDREDRRRPHRFRLRLSSLGRDVSPCGFDNPRAQGPLGKRQRKDPGEKRQCSLRLD